MVCSGRVVYTVGHSNRTLGYFIGMLRRYGVEVLVDVRRFPSSRRHPWFNREVLEKVLPEHGIRYVWLGDLLGGLGRDYIRFMCSREYRDGIERLYDLAVSSVVAVMCAEAYWRRCHRRFISESLMRRCLRVLHIIDYDRVEEHRGIDENLECV